MNISGTKLLLRWAIPLAIAVIVVVGGLKAFVGSDQRTVVAQFARTVSIYPGSDVRVLGVKVGSVEKVEPRGTSVEVTMRYDADVDIPADARAVIVSPSVVGDRFVQLTPAYISGPRLADGAVLETSRTATPLELDDIYGDLDTLIKALGPDGANKNGALSDLLNQSAKNLEGRGEQLHHTVGDVADLTRTLDNNKEELFSSAARLEGFIKTLADNDTTVQKFNESLASVSALLAGERRDLASSMRNLATALGDVHTFVTDNQDLLRQDIASLNRLATVVVKRRDALTETLDNAPLALTNLFHAYNPQAGTLDTNANIDKLLSYSLKNLPLTLCTALNNVDSTGTLCKALGGSARSGDLLGSALGTGSTIGKQTDPTLGGLVR